MKVLIVGLGSIGRKHVDALKALVPRIEIIALRSNENCKNLQGVRNIYSYKGVDKNSIDFAIVSNPTANHEETLRILTKFGIPLFIEKPLSLSFHIKDLIEEIDHRNLFTYVACNLRFLDCLKFIKESLSGELINQINEVNVYCGSYLPAWRPNMDYRKSYSSSTELGGGVHLDLIHELDYIYWLFDKPSEIIRKLRKQSALKISSYDYAYYGLDYEGFSANIVLNYYRRDSKRTLEILFENETWLVDLLKNQVSKNDEVIFSSKQTILETYKSQMQYFLKSFKARKLSVNSAMDAFEVLKICMENDT